MKHRAERRPTARELGSEGTPTLGRTGTEFAARDDPSLEQARRRQEVLRRSVINCCESMVGRPTVPHTQSR
jgi:hypothetical protein